MKVFVGYNDDEFTDISYISKKRRSTKDEVRELEE
jgi:hypothetical protein